MAEYCEIMAENEPINEFVDKFIYLKPLVNSDTKWV